MQRNLRQAAERGLDVIVVMRIEIGSDEVFVFNHTFILSQRYFFETE